jgi:hypothetical protein
MADEQPTNELKSRGKSIKVEDIIININVFGSTRQIDQSDDGAQINQQPPEVPEEEPAP